MRTLKVVKIEAPYFGCNETGFETDSKFVRTIRNDKVCRYLTILMQCRNESKTARMIYPNTKHPMCHQLRDLCRAGYLDRYEMTVPNGLPGPNPYYYKTTVAGENLLTMLGFEK